MPLSNVQQAAQLASQAAAAAHQGNIPGAIAAYQQAVQLYPDFAEAHASIASLSAHQGNHAAAVAHFQRALQLKPQFLDWYVHLAHALLMTSQFAAAEAPLHTYLRARPNDPAALHDLAIVYKSTGRLAEAIPLFDQALALQPKDAAAHANRGTALQFLGRLPEALEALECAAQLMPNHPDIHFRRAEILANLRRFEEALAAYQRAIQLKPDYADAWNNMGITLRMLGRVDDSVAAFCHAVSLRPNTADSWTNLAVLLDLKGERKEALAAHRRAVQLAPGDAAVHSNLLYALHFHPDISPQELLAEHRIWDERHAVPLRSSVTHNIDKNPTRPLRVGYVSPDFRDHPVGRFIAPLIAAHDPAAVQVFCYADVLTTDAITSHIQSHAHTWRNTTGMNDEALAEQIRQDQIDILVDLTMHMAGNRLLTFARKPAPIQVTYLAYVSTTGMSAMDYRLSDPYLDPPSSDLSIYTEKTIHLPNYWCYSAPTVAPEPNQLPALTSADRGVTFGCLNGFSKVSDDALAAWAQILAVVPNAKLLLHANPGGHRQRVHAFLQARGIDPTRCQFLPLGRLEQYFHNYHLIDIALDPFPYAGGTTSCDALYMGLPLITLATNRAIGRGGVSILSTLGIPEWIAPDTASYVRIAQALSSDLAALAQHRATLRGRLQNSPLTNPTILARAMESAFRDMRHARAQDEV